MLLLSHGQASVERGFSVNKNLLTENIKAKSIVAQRSIVDHVRSVSGVANVEVDKEFLKYARGTRSRYHDYLEEIRKTKEESLHTRKRKLAQEEINSLKTKRNRIENSLRRLHASADSLALQAEKENKMELLTNYNAFRKSAKDKEAEVLQLDEQIKQKTEELKLI